MFKKVLDDVWAFDCEWVPDIRSGIVMLDLPPSTPPQRVMEAMWVQGGATAEDPQPFLKTVLCRVVSIAAVRRRVIDGKTKVELLWQPRHFDDIQKCEEAEVLQNFLGAVGKVKPQLVGFNSRSADLKILLQRAVVNGLYLPDLCQRPDKPWEGVDYFGRDNDYHIDLIETLSTWGNHGRVSLNEIARLSGIPGKFGVSGDDVAGMWLQGRIREIVQYNCFDAITTYLVWLRMAHLGGFFTNEQYEEEQNEVRDTIFGLLEHPDHGYLEYYLEEWERLESLQQELAANSQQGFPAADINQ